jgi:uncharacterized small protein (DUF1192 family)
MDWDEARAPAAKVITLGEPLGSASIAELGARVAALEAEIVRVKTEIEGKRQQAAAASAFFSK